MRLWRVGQSLPFCGHGPDQHAPVAQDLALELGKHG